MSEKWLRLIVVVTMVLAVELLCRVGIIPRMVMLAPSQMVVELAENILFDSGKADLKAEGKTALQEVAGVLASIGGRDFQITGHTDNIPIKSAKFPSNWELSTARAVTVTRFLAESGVPTFRGAGGFRAVLFVEQCTYATHGKVP